MRLRAHTPPKLLTCFFEMLTRSVLTHFCCICSLLRFIEYVGKTLGNDVVESFDVLDDEIFKTHSASDYGDFHVQYVREVL